MYKSSIFFCTGADAAEYDYSDIIIVRLLFYLSFNKTPQKL